MTSQTIFIQGRAVTIDLPTTSKLAHEGVGLIFKTLGDFIVNNVADGKFAPCNELIPYFIVKHGSSLDKELCRCDESYDTLRSDGSTAAMIMYRGLLYNSGHTVVKDYYCTTIDWVNYKYGNELTLGDTMPLFKLLNLAIAAINKEFDGRLVLRAADLDCGHDQLYIFRPPRAEASPITIEVFHENIMDEIKCLMILAQFNAVKTFGALNDKDRFLQELARLFGDLENGPESLLVSWGPGGIGDVSDFTVQSGGNDWGFVYDGGLVAGKYPNLTLTVSPIYAAACKLSSSEKVTSSNLRYVRLELGDQWAINDRAALNVIKACLARFEITKNTA